jgi:uncharacterized membrane protein
VEDLQWSEAYAYQTRPGELFKFKLHIYNFATNTATGRLRIASQPERWESTLNMTNFTVAPMEQAQLTGTLRIPLDAEDQDGSVTLTADCEQAGRPALAFRVVVRR